ncbi:hypothetical protein GCM10017744_049930 [Streptomyces antimycoticus]|uniref:Uncharacterized protein n=1 Tax=Streptomyces antimycoticus TaxID=68175 RepID=A0A4D4KBU4_9ACTN|nr:hypothetical protein SANT12839_052320 [Streptomyces antimycoticus]
MEQLPHRPFGTGVHIGLPTHPGRDAGAGGVGYTHGPSVLLPDTPSVLDRGVASRLAQGSRRGRSFGHETRGAGVHRRWPASRWGASGEEIDRRVEQIHAIPTPVTAQEARALADCFGSDDCHGVVWSLLHLIETGPNPVLATKPAPDANEWQHLLWTRAANAGLVRDE